MGKAESTQAAGSLFQAEYGHFINGKWEGGASGEKIGLHNPATGALLSNIQSGNAADAVRAVDAAYAAFSSWRQTRPNQRQELLFEMARREQKAQKEAERLAKLKGARRAPAPISAPAPVPVPTPAPNDTA